jgi:parallel beta-helix repeat protein
LQSKVVDALFEPVDPGIWSGASILNSTLVRTLDLYGDYVGDKELFLPSLFRLRLKGSLTVDPSVSTSVPFAALIRLENVSYSAVIGGTYNASGQGGFNAISLVGSSRCIVNGIRGLSDTNVIAVNKGSTNEVAHNNIGPGSHRCIWTLVASRALVHSNQVHGCQGHSIDFDAYTSNSVAYNNTCSQNGQQGIFVEETASNNVIVANTIMHSTASGIGVYSMDVGPVKGNTFIGNRILDNIGTGITAGGYGHNPDKHSDHNIFADNFLSGNSIGVNIHHGTTDGDFWTDNINEDSWKGDPQNSSEVVVFDPISEIGQGRETMSADILV